MVAHDDAVVEAVTPDEPVTPDELVDGAAVSWGQRLVWGDSLVWGDAIYWNEPAWAQRIVWGDRRYLSRPQGWTRTKVMHAPYCVSGCRLMIVRQRPRRLSPTHEI